MPPSEQFSIERVAKLARIEVSNHESVKIKDQIAQILNFINVLDELSLDSVQPFFGLELAAVDPEHSPQRDDESGDEILRSKILANAPNQDDEFYKVPPVF